MLYPYYLLFCDKRRVKWIDIYPVGMLPKDNIKGKYNNKKSISLNSYTHNLSQKNDMQEPYRATKLMQKKQYNVSNRL